MATSTLLECEDGAAAKVEIPDRILDEGGTGDSALRLLLEGIERLRDTA